MSVNCTKCGSDDIVICPYYCSWWACYSCEYCNRIKGNKCKHMVHI